jgi:cytochrome c oxidase cbb3-type subunit III
MSAAQEHDKVTGRQTTGHEWDGIKELNTPLPSWWLYVLYATIVWAIGYWIVYPAWPSLSSYTAGLFGYSTRAEFSKDMLAEAAARQVWTDQLKGLPVDQVAANPDLLNYSMAGGRAIFAVNCQPCHGAGGQGAPGYPVLADDDWIWGGDLASIEQTIRYGVRSVHESTRLSEMPRFGADAMLTPEQIADTADYVVTLSGGKSDAAAAERGKALFAEQCAACHGEQGKGMLELGAPNLTDQIWLYGGSREQIVAQITAPKQGVMPTWEGKLDDNTVKMLTVYVHSLGGGQ